MGFQLSYQNCGMGFINHLNGFHQSQSIVRKLKSFYIIFLFFSGGICRAVVGVGPSRVGQEKEKRKTEVRLALVVIIVVAIWFTAWTPYAVVALLGINGYGHLITPTASMLPALFCKTASCVDPFIYAFTHPRY